MAASAYRFNGLSDQERAALHRRYQQAVASQGYDRLPEDLAAWFPFDNTVDATTLLMQAPR